MLSSDSNLNKNNHELPPQLSAYNFMNDDIDDDIDFQIIIQKHNSNGSSICDEYANSDSDSSEEKKTHYSDENSSIISYKKPYKKLTFEEVEFSIRKHYYNDKHHNELDILITFIKGQKHIYRQSFYLTQRKVALLVTPCLIITGSIMVIAPIIQPYSWSGFFLSALNAALTIFISILNFWNLQFYMMQYNVYSAHFDRLETSLILTRNKTLLLDNPQKKTELIIEKMKDTETRMLEMKEDHPVYIPIEVKTQVPNISHIDIFAFIQKVDQNIKNLIIKYKDIKNEIRYIMYKWKLRENMDFINDNNENVNNNDKNYQNIQKITRKKNHETYYRTFINLENNPISRKEHERQRLMHLFNQKETIKKEIINSHQKYSYVDQIFTREIEIAENNQNTFWFLCWYYIPLCNNRNKFHISLENME